MGSITAAISCSKGNSAETKYFLEIWPKLHCSKVQCCEDTVACTNP